MSRAYRCMLLNEFRHETFSLVPIRDEDKYLIMQWRNEQIGILRQKELLTKEQQERYFAEVVDKLFLTDKPNQLLFSFLDNGRLIGYGGLVHIDWDSGNGEISFLTETSRNTSRQMFMNDWSVYLRLLKEMVQSTIRFQKIYTYAYDVRPLLFEALLASNFREEARLRKHIRIDQQLYDVLIHSYFFDDIVLRHATSDDMMMYFEWTNDSNVRRNSFNQSAVSLESHRDWFTKKLAAKSTMLCVAEVANVAIGQIRFDEVEITTFEISFSIAAEFRGKGLASKLLEAGVEKVKRERPDIRIIRGKVKTENTSSSRAFEIAGFSVGEKKDGVITFMIDV